MSFTDPIVPDPLWERPTPTIDDDDVYDDEEEE